MAVPLGHVIKMAVLARPPSYELIPVLNELGSPPGLIALFEKSELTGWHHLLTLGHDASGLIDWVPDAISEGKGFACLQAWARALAQEAAQVLP